MMRSILPLGGVLGVLLLAGGVGAESEAAAAEETATLSGMWAVEGSTVEQGNEANKRQISGTVILTQEGVRYTSTFTMKTMFPTPDGASLSTDVIGKGEGEIQGNSLSGTASTQLVMATVPGVDPAFAFVPRTVSTRIVSNMTGTVQSDGSLLLQIESAPAPGETYRPTRTTLRCKRIDESTVSAPPE